MKRILESIEMTVFIGLLFVMCAVCLVSQFVLPEDPWEKGVV